MWPTLLPTDVPLHLEVLTPRRPEISGTLPRRFFSRRIRMMKRLPAGWRCACCAKPNGTSWTSLLRRAACRNARRRAGRNCARPAIISVLVWKRPRPAGWTMSARHPCQGSGSLVKEGGRHCRTFGKAPAKSGFLPARSRLEQHAHRRAFPCAGRAQTGAPPMLPRRNGILGPDATPNLLVEYSTADMADLVAANVLSRGRGEAQSVSRPASGVDAGQRAARRGIGGRAGGAAPHFMFAQIYRLRHWDGSEAEQCFAGGRFLSVSTNPATLFP